MKTQWKLGCVPEGEPDCIEAQSLLSVHNRGKVTDLAEVSRVCIICIETIHHSLTSFEAKPIDTLLTGFLSKSFQKSICSSYIHNNLYL